MYRLTAYSLYAAVSVGLQVWVFILNKPLFNQKQLGLWFYLFLFKNRIGRQF